MNSTYSVPTEVLMEILFYLPSKDLLRCRIVCLRWKKIIDGLTKNEFLWQRHSIKDFSDIYESAYIKSRPGLSWYQLYRSLTLWPKLAYARETVSQLVSAKCPTDEIRAIHVVRDGVTAVHRVEKIVYYNTNTLRRSKRDDITGRYRKYQEFNDIILILGFDLQLSILQAIKTHNVIFDTLNNVLTFLVVGNIIYYLTKDNKIFASEIVNRKFISTMLKRVPFEVSALGFRDGLLHIMALDCGVFALINNEFIYIRSMVLCKNLIIELKNYKFMDIINWGAYFQAVSAVYQSLYPVPMDHITATLIYGRVKFIGTNWGVLYIFTLNNNPADVLQPRQLKRYSFIDPKEYYNLSMVPITHIDIIEGKDKHTVLVAMPKKVVVIKFVHIFNEQNTMVSCNQELEIKMLQC